MATMLPGFFVLWNPRLGVEEVGKRGDIRFVHRFLLQGPLGLLLCCRLGRLEAQAAGRDDDAGVHADTLVEDVPLSDHGPHHATLP